MLPLSFREFLCITGMDAERGLAEYLRDGGLPYIAVMDRTAGKVETYLEGIYNTVIVKDIEDRQARKESNPDKRKITDILLLKTCESVICQDNLFVIVTNKGQRPKFTFKGFLRSHICCDLKIHVYEIFAKKLQPCRLDKAGAYAII